MKIHDHPTSAFKPSPTSTQPFRAPEAADINWFNALLKAPAAATLYTPVPETRFAQPLTQRSTLLQDLSNTAARALQKVSTSTDPMDMLKSTRAMSAFHLETVLSAKMISKTAQAIDKLTNLS